MQSILSDQIHSRLSTNINLTPEKSNVSVSRKRGGCKKRISNSTGSPTFVPKIWFSLGLSDYAPYSLSGTGRGRVLINLSPVPKQCPLGTESEGLRVHQPVLNSRREDILAMKLESVLEYSASLSSPLRRSFLAGEDDLSFLSRSYYPN